MNKKFLSAILFGALMVTSTGTFVSCKDYDDDIKDLQEQITDNATAIAALEAQIKSGEWVSGVTSTTDGIVVTLGNGTNYTIKNGAAGQDGATPKLAVSNGNIQVSYDDGATWTNLVALEDLKGDKGDAAEAPVFSVGDDGHIYVQYGEDGEKKDLGVSTGGIYYVEDGVKLTIHVPNEAGEYKDIVLPRAAAISSIKAVTVDDDAVLIDGADLDLYYGIATADGKYLDGTAFKKGDILLPTKEANTVLSAQVNPTIADATVYNFYLVNSKGNSIFKLTSATPNMTEDPLTRPARTATANKGIYDMGITFADGITSTQINNASGAYAITTKDAYDNEVLSAYDVVVETTQAISSSLTVDENSVEAEINKDFDLSDCVTMSNVIDVQYYFATDQKANVDAAKATITGSKIKGEVAGKSVVVSVKYLTCTGTEEEETSTITVKFIAPATENAFTQTLVLDADHENNVLTFDVTSLIGNTTVSGANFFSNIGNAKFTVAAEDKNDDLEYAKGADAVGITAPTAVYSDNATNVANGYYKHTLTYTVDNETVIPGTYEAELTYGSSPTNTVKLTLIVKEDVSSYNFKPLDLYFTGNSATTYGTPNGNTISYNLTGLFGITDWDNVEFTETVPEAYEDADGIKWTSNAWLVEDEDAELGDIVVDKVASKNATTKTGIFGGAYKARELKATYTPYGNKNLTATEYDFDLTIKSAVYEGSLDYVKKVEILGSDGKGTGRYNYVVGDAKTINVATVGAKATLKAEEIRGITKTAVEYFADNDATNAHIVSITAALEGDNANQYLDLIGDFENDNITTTPKANVTIPGDGKSVTCYVRVSVLDEWGKTKTVDVPVVLQ